MVTTIKKLLFNKEAKIVAIISLVSIILSTAPYLYLYFTKLDNSIYLWAHAFNTGDTMVYFSYIEQVKQGHFLFKDLFTSEPHLRFLNIFWLLTGFLAKLLNLTSAAAYHAVRILLIPIFIWTLKKTSDYFLPNNRHSTTILLFLAYFTGFGIMLNPFLQNGLVAEMVAGLDLACPEATPYMSMLFSGHFIMSWICLLWSIILISKMYQFKSLKYAAGAGFLSLFFLQFHPYYAPLIFLFSFFTGFYFYFTKKNNTLTTLKLIITHALISLPAILYYIYFLLFDYRFSIFFKQNNTPSPEWWVILLSFGPLFPLAIIGIIKLYRDKNISIKNFLLILWLVLSTILLFSPFKSQRRFIEGMFVPILLLAWPIIESIYYFIMKPKRNKIVAVSIIIFTLLLSSQTTFFIFFITHRLQHNQPDYIYYPDDIIKPIAWIKKNIQESDIILSSKFSGIFIAGLAGKQTYLGHRGETLFFDEKKKTENAFFYSLTDIQRIKFLVDNKLTILYWSNKEKAESTDFNPDSKPYLTKIYNDSTTQIYRIIK